MADKQLTESAWKAFAKGKPPYKDAALLKALGALDKAEKAGPADWLEALDDVDKQADLLRKANKADKELGGYLDGVEKAAAKDRKTAEAARDKAAAAAASADEEEDSPALLTTKLVPLLRQVRKGDVVLQALIATTGKETAVLLSKKSIAPTRGKLLKEYLGVSGAVKLIKGECLFEANAHTFVVQTQAAGLAKKLKAALLAQTELRVKVRVRGEDPNDLDDDGDEVAIADDDGGNPGAATADAGAAAAASAATAAPATAPAEAPPAPPPPSAAYAAKLAQMQSRIDSGLAQPAIAAKVKGLVDFAQGKAAADNHLAALQALATLEKLLASAAAAAAPGETPGVDPGAAFNARLTALMPRVKEALTAGGSSAQDIKLKTSDAGVAARKREFDAAHALLDTVENLLTGRPAAGSTTTTTAPPAGAGPSADANPQSAEYTALLATLQPRYEAAMAATTSTDAIEQRDAARRAWDLAAAAAAAENFERAVLILKRLDDGGLLDRIATATRPEATQDLVAQRNFLLTRWLQIPAELRTGLATLQAGLEASGEDADPEQLFDDVSDYLDELLDGLKDRIDKAINGGSAAAAFDGMVDEINKEPVLTLLDSNPIDSGVRFKQTVIDAVREVAAQFETA